MDDEWHKKNEALRTRAAKRLNGAFLAFSHENVEWPVRRLLLATVLELTEAEIDRGMAELKRVGLMREGWMQ